jgi:hypothetical protein
LTLTILLRTLKITMFSGFATGKVLLRGLSREAKSFTQDFPANKKIQLSPACRCDGQRPGHPR